MATVLNTILGWFRGGGVAIADSSGEQNPVPSVPLVSDSQAVGVDGAMQMSTVWSCIERRATTVASLPFFAYTDVEGRRKVARTSRLYQLLHDSPNARMTPFDFWRTMMLNHDLRGNAYARIDRDQATGEAVALWPMAADQTQTWVMDDGAVLYVYRVGDDVAVLAEENVLHLKGLGNGTTGLAKLEFMRATTGEAQAAQTSASRIFGNGGKPTGVLMIDKVLTAQQREVLKSSMAGMSYGSTSRLFLLEAAMTYQQLSISPEDQQLLDTRRFGVEEMCRWFDVPPVLVHHSNVTTWGSGIEQIVDGFHKFSIRPMLVSIEQAVRKRVMTARQRASMSVEFSLDALLRGSAKDRAELYAKNVQNGVMTRNEVRQLENLPAKAGGDALTVQANLVPIEMLGKVNPMGAANALQENPVAQ